MPFVNVESVTEVGGWLPWDRGLEHSVPSADLQEGRGTGGSGCHQWPVLYNPSCLGKEASIETQGTRFGQVDGRVEIWKGRQARRGLPPSPHVAVCISSLWLF